MSGHTWVDCRCTLAALFERPVVIKPPEVVATHDFLLIGWILLFLMSLPWLGIGAISLAVGALLYVGYAAPAVVAMLTTGSSLIDSWTVFFAFSFATQPLSPILIGVGAVAVFLILIGVVYWTTVRRTGTGNYEGARAASLFYGVIMILVSLASFAAFFGYVYAASAAILILPALFFLMGYGKMGEVIARYGPMAVLSDASPIETASQIPSGAAVPAMPMMAAPAMGMGAVAVPANSGGTFPTPAPPPSPHYQHLGGAVPRVPLCPTCGRELFYASNYKRWYCLVCESRR
jgi:ribosomal protein S27AE